MSASDDLTRLMHADREYRAALKAVQSNGAAVLREVREQMGGISKRELARRLSVHVSTISKVEAGTQAATRPLLARLARVAAGLPPVEDRPGRAAAHGV